MKVGIVGSGEVGRALARGFSSKGNSVMIGSRSPERPELVEWRKQQRPEIRTGTFAQAAEFGEVLIVAVHGEAAEAAVDLAGPTHFAGKLVLDATNPLDFSKGMPPGLSTVGKTSLSERIQSRLPGAKVVKCFNTVPNSLMVDPVTHAGPPDMLICGDDAAAKRQTTEILRTLGWPRTIDLGGLQEAGWLEAWVPLWVRIALSLQRFDVALKIVEGAKPA